MIYKMIYRNNYIIYSLVTKQRSIDCYVTNT